MTLGAKPKRPRSLQEAALRGWEAQAAPVKFATFPPTARVPADGLLPPGKSAEERVRSSSLSSSDDGC